MPPRGIPRGGIRFLCYGERSPSLWPASRAQASAWIPPILGGVSFLLDFAPFTGARAPPRKAPDLPLGGARGVSPAAFLGAGRNLDDAMSLDHTKTALAVTAVVVGLAGMAALVYVEVRGL